LFHEKPRTVFDGQKLAQSMPCLPGRDLQTAGFTVDRGRRRGRPRAYPVHPFAAGSGRRVDTGIETGVVQGDQGEVAGLAGFLLAGGIRLFSVSPGHVEALKKYIDNQEEHHRQESFQEEFLRLLRKYGVAYDERYVWD